MGDCENRLKEFLTKVSSDLDRVVQFWLSNSHDKTYGGYLICLGEDGHVYDDTKYTWLESRQVWMYARLYNEVERFKTTSILDAAEHGAKFLLQHVKQADTGRCYLAVSRHGQPKKIQRTIFSECFYLMALSELYRATGNKQYRTEALNMMSQIIHWARYDDSDLGREKLSGNLPVTSLGIPMMLLALTEQLVTMEAALEKDYADTVQWCLAEITKHVQRDGSVVLENVSPEGKEIPGCLGRLINPGHAIETGWFLLQYATRKGDAFLQKMATDNFILTSFNLGWDKKFGGIFYFLDVDNESPIQLEWDMKLWWPHNEAMIALLMAYSSTKDKQFLDKFAQVFDYSYAHFADETNGEWFGYLNRWGEITHRFKGGPWKGFFHIPRCLMMCEQMLEALLQQSK